MFPRCCGNASLACSSVLVPVGAAALRAFPTFGTDSGALWQFARIIIQYHAALQPAAGCEVQCDDKRLCGINLKPNLKSAVVPRSSFPPL